MLSRAIVLLVIFGLVACERPTAPVPVSKVAARGPSFDNSTIKDNETIDLSGVIVSPCTGEEVAFQGTGHVVATITPNADGSFTVSAHFNTQSVSGVGLETGTKYQLSQVSNEDQTVNSDQTSGSAVVRTQFRIISDGSLDNFLLDSNLTFTFPPATATYKFDNARCVGSTTTTTTTG